MKISKLICYSFLLISTSSLADTMPGSILPPKYLTVPQWQSCVGTVIKGNAQFICLPAIKPDACPNNSWNALINLHEIDNCA